MLETFKYFTVAELKIIVTLLTTNEWLVLKYPVYVWFIALALSACTVKLFPPYEPVAILIKGLSVLSQFVETVKVTFKLSLFALFRTVSSLAIFCKPEPRKTRLSIENIGVSTDGLLPLFTGLSLPQAINIITSDNILRCINIFLIGAMTFLIDTFIVLVGICSFFGVIPVNFSQCLLNHFKARFCNFLTANSFFNFFTIQFNKIQVIIQDTFLNPLKSKVSYI